MKTLNGVEILPAGHFDPDLVLEQAQEMITLLAEVGLVLAYLKRNHPHANVSPELVADLLERVTRCHARAKGWE